MQRVAKNAGGTFHADLHTFRRTYATLFSGTTKIQTIQYLLGHKDIRAYREAKLPFPEATVIARIAWSYVASEENNKVCGRPQPFVPGPAKNVQFMVKDSRKYASTGGWRCADFKDGKPADESVHKTCFPCHELAKARDFVFTHYAP